MHRESSGGSIWTVFAAAFAIASVGLVGLVTIAGAGVAHSQEPSHRGAAPVHADTTPAMRLASAEHGPYGPGYAGYYRRNYYIGSHPAPPRYSYPLTIAPQPRWYGRPAPWSPAWFDACSARYRSFDPHTGYFTTYSGRKVFCR